MSRRTTASLLAFGLLVVLLVVASQLRVPWVVYGAGPTVNVLGQYDQKPIIEVSGHRAYRDQGGLRLVTVVSNGGPGDHVNFLGALSAWLDPKSAVLPYDAVYQPTDTRGSVRQESTQQMVSSQDNAVAAALGALDIGFTSAVTVSSVTKDGPSDGVLRAGDLLRSVDGTRVDTPEKLRDAIRTHRPGSTLDLEVRRSGTVKQVRVTTAPAPDDKSASVIGVSIRPSYEFPFQVSLNLDEHIGGPSAGMMFALGIYDVLTKGSLTHGEVIAGTGEIDAKGKVGPIGGIGQKIVGAQRDGARLFLVPADNCAEALTASYDHDRIRLVRVSTLEDAIDDVTAWAADPDTKLPRCTS